MQPLRADRNKPKPALRLAGPCGAEAEVLLQAEVLFQPEVLAAEDSPATMLALAEADSAGAKEVGSLVSDQRWTVCREGERSRTAAVSTA